MTSIPKASILDTDGARVHNVISPFTNAEFQRHLKGKTKPYVKGRTADGFLIVDTGREFGIGNTIIITDGDRKAPSIERVYQISYDRTDDAETVRRVIYAEEQEYGEAALYFVGDDYGLVLGFERGSMPTYEDLSAQGRRVGLRGLRGEAFESDPELSDGGSRGRSDTRYALGEVTLPSPGIIDGMIDDFLGQMSAPPEPRPTTPSHNPSIATGKMDSASQRMSRVSTPRQMNIISRMLSDRKQTMQALALKVLSVSLLM